MPNLGDFNFSASPSSSIGSSTPNLGVDTASLGGLSPIGALLKSIDVSATQGRNLPWDSRNSNVNSSFFHYIDVDGTRWNQLFPYRLVVIDTSNGNKIVRGVLPDNGAIFFYNQGTTQIISFEPVNTEWTFSLPISPQQLNIVDQYAINTSATLRGILEEHNGIKFKMISASGTMGVWPYRQSVSKPPSSPNVLQSIFGGTISAVTSLVSQVNATINTFTTGSPNSKPVTVKPEDANPGLDSTGYYQAMMLEQFLEQYVEAKKDPANAGWRLVFDIPKQNTSYIVTPMQYTWQQSAQKPMEMMFQLQFKAWRRVVLGVAPVLQNENNPYTITPGILQRVLNTITEARLTMSSAVAVIGAVRSDIDNVFNVLNQTSLFVKDALGVATTASDLPSSIAKDFNSAIQSFVFNNSTAVAAAVSTTAGAAAVAAILAAQNSRNGLSQTAASNGQLGQGISNSQQTNTAAAILNNPNANADLLDQVPNNQLVLNTAQQNKLNQILSNTSLTVAQLKSNANTIQSLAVQLAGYFGAGSQLYNEIYNLTPPTSRIQPMSINEFLILDTLYDFIQAIGILTATTQVTDQNIVSSLDYVAGLANQSNIPFDVPTSKIIVPVPANTTIEGISARYLGDPDRWVEIATLNKLQEPYLDYQGFQLPLLSNAIGRQVIVSSAADLYLGQVATIRSLTQIQTARNITAITPLPNGNGFILTMDGPPNLDNFTLADSAYLQMYLPNTVNAQQKIFIPSTLPAAQLQDQVNVPLPPTVSLSGDPLAQISGVDFLLDEEGDIVLDQYGNFQLAYGMTNIIQWLRILFTTTLNSFMLEPTFGLGVSPGTSISDVKIQQLYRQINQQIQSDPRFAAVTSLQIQANPPNLTISVGIQVAGVTGVFPVNFSVAA
jgi:hypothetical protein